MNNDKISTNICKTFETDDCVIFKAICSCQSDDHTLTLILSRDKNVIEMNICSTASTKYYSFSHDKFYIINLIRDLFFRIKMAFKILFLGHVETEFDFLFTDEKAIRDYIIALQEGLDNIKRFNKPNINK